MPGVAVPIDRDTQDRPPEGQRPRLTAFLRERRTDILNAWIVAARALPIARDLEQPLLIDHVPAILDRIAELADDLHAGGSAELPREVAELHALARLDEGFDLSQVITELAMLRDCIMRLWEATVGQTTFLHELRILDHAIDRTITASTDRYTQARDRTLQALDRIATAAFESAGVDDLLRRLLRVLIETTAAVDTAAILLREGDILRVRAAVGLGREMEEGFSMKIGEGFSGSIAAAGVPMARNSAPAEPPTKSPILRNADLGALYGVPLVQDGFVIGVAHMGSKTAHAFSVQDRRLFSALVARATSAIHQHLLYETTRRTAAELRARELELRTIADNIPQLAWMADSDGARLWFNRRWFEYTGTTFEQAQGWGWQAAHHPDHLARVNAGFERAVATGGTWEDTYPLRGADGRYRWFLSRGVPILDDRGAIIRWFGTNTDVTEQRILAEAAQVLSSSLDYDDVLAHVARLAVPALADACAIDVVDDHGALRRIASAGTDQHPLDADCDRAVADAIASGEPVLLPSREEPSCAVVPLVARGRVQGAITLQLGAPRRYRQADVDVAIELGRRAGHALDNARLYRQAQDASKLRDEVLAIVSHDLRTPLSSIDLSTTMLLDRHGDDLRSRKQLGLVRRSIDRMNHLIRDLLDMASIEAGKLSLELRREDVQPMLDEIIDLHEPLAADKGIRIMRSYEVDGVHVTCDRERIAQVLGNLLGNAKKYCSSGDVIMVSARRTGADLLIVVEDSGPGIAPGDLPHVFELFWSSSAHPQHGAGLGLYISMGLVQAHGGRISAESAPGRGARFTVTLPIAES